MIISNGEKLHVMYRALYEGATRRHIVGEVMASNGSVCRIEGYVFIYDAKSTMFVRKKKKRTSIIDVAESGYIVNIIDSDVDLDDVEYKYSIENGVVVTDGKKMDLNINEFGVRG